MHYLLLDAPANSVVLTSHCAAISEGLCKLHECSIRCMLLP